MKASGASSILGMSVHGTLCFITVPRNLQVESRILKAEFVSSLITAITVITLCWALSGPNGPHRWSTSLVPVL